MMCREKCYIGRSSDMGFYETAFIAELSLPLSSLCRQLATYMGIFVSHIAPNAWRIFIVVKVLWCQLSGVHWSLTLKKFFYCYKPQEIPRSKGFYNFMCHQAALRLISDMSNSNRQWKARFFFMQRVNCVCHLDKWDSI